MTAVSMNQGRIPEALKAIFLASNRGEEVFAPPVDRSASRVFFRPRKQHGKSCVSRENRQVCLTPVRVVSLCYCSIAQNCDFVSRLTDGVAYTCAFADIASKALASQTQRPRILPTEVLFEGYGLLQ